MLLASLALNSIGLKPSASEHNIAAVVFPIPGGPDNNNALGESFLNIAPDFLYLFIFFLKFNNIINIINIII